MYDNEFCIHWQLIVSHILSQVSLLYYETDTNILLLKCSSDCLLKSQDDTDCRLI